MPEPQKPSICRIVVYRSRTGNYSVPAVVTATEDSLYRPGVEGGFVPDLSSPMHVHLTVFTPGLPGMRVTAEDFEAPVPEGQVISENVAGCYQEWNVPFEALRLGGPVDDPHHLVPSAGTWHWPPRV